MNKIDSLKLKPYMRLHSTWYAAVICLLALFFAVYAVAHFQYMYSSMEGDVLWLSSLEFWQQKLSMPPSVSFWITDYLLQWFARPLLATFLHTFLLVLVAILAHVWLLRLMPRKRAIGWLALAPVVLLGYWCTFEIHLMVESVFFFAMLILHTMVGNTRWRLALSFVLLPVGYMLVCMPMLGMMLAGMMLAEWLLFASRNWRMQLLGWAVLYLIPIVYSEQVSFVDFRNRYTQANALMVPLLGSELTFTMRIHTYVALANEEKWEQLLYQYHCRSEAQRGDGVALRFALLAERELGTLPQHILDYPIAHEDMFFYPHVRDYLATQFNRLFYEHLGVYDEAFHQTQEFGLLQVGGICFSSLRQMTEYSIREGEWEVADKYLRILAQSSCHDEFVRTKRLEISEGKRTFKRQIPLRADNFVGGYALPFEMLRMYRYYQGSPHRKKMLDYALCSFMFRGDKERFAQICTLGNFYNEENAPESYRMFLAN